MQYARYIGDLLKGDLGTSIRTGAAITQEIKPYLFATLELAFFAMLIAVFVGVNAGIISAWFKNSVFDYIAMLVALIGVSMPIFWLGLMGQLFFSIELGWSADNRKGECQKSGRSHYVHSYIGHPFARKI